MPLWASPFIPSVRLHAPRVSRSARRDDDDDETGPCTSVAAAAASCKNRRLPCRRKTLFTVLGDRQRRERKWERERGLPRVGVELFVEANVVGIRGLRWSSVCFSVVSAAFWMHPRSSSHTRREQIGDDDSSSFNRHRHRTRSRTRGEQIDKERTDRWGFLFLLLIYLSSPASHIHRTSVFFTRLFIVCLFWCNLQFSRDGEVLGNNQQTVVTDCPCVGYPCSCDLDSMELLFPWRIRPQWQRRFQCKRSLSLSLSLSLPCFSL